MLLGFFQKKSDSYTKSDLDTKITDIQRFIETELTKYRTIAKCGDINDLKNVNVHNEGVHIVIEKIDSMSEELKKKVNEINIILEYPNVELEPLPDNGNQADVNQNQADVNQNQADVNQNQADVNQNQANKPITKIREKEHDRFYEMYQGNTPSNIKNEIEKEKLKKQTIVNKILEQNKSKSDLEKIVKSLKTHSEKIEKYIKDFRWEKASDSEKCRNLSFKISEYINECSMVLVKHNVELSYMINVYEKAIESTRSTGGKNARKSIKSRKSRKSRKYRKSRKM
jgi:hypothetical protein